MKKLLPQILYLWIFGFSLMLTAQEKTQIIGKKVNDLNGKPKLIVFQKSAPYQLKEPMKVLREQLKLSENDSYEKMRSEVDQTGFTHDKYQQIYKGLKVEFSTYTLHAKNGKVTSISGEYHEIKELRTTPKLTRQQAFAMALNHIGAKNYLWEYPDAAKELDNYKKPKGELVILPMQYGKNTEGYKLAYKFDIYATNPLSRGDVYLDAQTGEVLFYNAIIKHTSKFGHVGEVNVRAKKAKVSLPENIANSSMAALVTGTADTRYSGSRSIATTSSRGPYRLSDSNRKIYTRNALNQDPGTSYPYISNYSQFYDSDNNWTSAEHSPNKDDAALDAHWGTMMTYDYFLNTFGRNSYDNAGAQIRNYVHVGVNYPNAFWNGSVLSYGDGDSNGSEGNGSYDALTSIDIVAHEYGHAVCQSTANLTYAGEPGALNEGLSDIWGAVIEHYAKGNGNDMAPDNTIWLVADEPHKQLGSTAMRSMSDPNSVNQPDTYGGTYWVDPNCGTPTNGNDYCGVHFNSGVLNYWFYLLTAGGSGTNDNGSSYTVSGIGIAKAAAIVYRMETIYLTAGSTFTDARTFALLAARDLYGNPGTDIVSAEEIAVANAWYAVGVGNEYSAEESAYCLSYAVNTVRGSIGSVSLGSIDNISGSDNGYADFSYLQTNLVKGVQNSITITAERPYGSDPMGYAVWIDYNQDNDFNDAGELVYNQAANTNTSVTGNFIVPSSALNGTTRMRVSMKYNGIPSSCETFTWGEVEDYTVEISTTDTEAPSAPYGLLTIAFNNPLTTTNLIWYSSEDNIAVTAYEVYKDGVLQTTTTDTLTEITGLSPDTLYDFHVIAKDAAGNLSEPSEVLTMMTNGTILHQGFFETGWDGWIDGGSYCARSSHAPYAAEGSHSILIGNNGGIQSSMTLSSYDVTPYEAIDINFSFLFYSMETGDDFLVKYYDGTSWNTVATFARGSTYANNVFYTTKVTIDKNTYTLPTNAQFRIECDAGSGGDYVYIDAITIAGINTLANSGTSKVVQLDNNQLSDNFDNDFKVYPNPVRNTLILTLTAETKATYNVTNLMGQTLMSGELMNSQLNVAPLSKGIYLISINDGKNTTVKKFIKE